MDAAPVIPIRLTLKGDVLPGNTLQAVVLIGHPMESGYRTLDSGQRVPKNVIDTIRVQLNGQTLLEAETGIGISAHPYFSFPVQLPVIVPATGLTLSVTWLDDKGQHGELQRQLR